MKLQKTYQKFQATAKIFLNDIKKYNEEPFRRKFLKDGWSVGQLYQHLAYRSQDFFLKNMRDCINKENGGTKGSKTFAGFLVFTLGKIPEFKVNKLKEPPQPKDTSDIENIFFRLIREMHQISRKLPEVDLNYKTRHPRYGMLNAREWFELTERYYRECLKYKREIDYAMSNSVK